MTTESLALGFPRGSNAQVGAYFRAREFDCRCSHCTETWIDPRLVSRLDRLRALLGVRIMIISGYRCDFQQQQLKAQGFSVAAGRSTHQDGMAADIRSDELSGEYLCALAEQVGFQAIGVAKDWIHVDIRVGRRRWTY